MQHARLALVEDHHRVDEVPSAFNVRL